jgi:hypothetical protein
MAVLTHHNTAEWSGIFCQKEGSLIWSEELSRLTEIG